MTRIFLTLAIFSTAGLAAAFLLGLNIGDAHELTRSTQERVSLHFLAGVAALVFAVLVHAIVLTYFMGTGRWLEETSQAYHLSDQWQQQSKTLKHRTIPLMAFSITLLVVTGAFGGAADPASAVEFQGWGSLSAAQVHLAVTCLSLLINVAVNIREYRELQRNGRLVNEVMEQVERMRRERGLEPSSAARQA